MPNPIRNHWPRALALLAVVPFLMGFESRREEGVTVGLGGAYGRGHYSTGCSHREFHQRYASGALAVDYTFRHDSARIYRPQITLGGRVGMVRTETRLLYDAEEGSGVPLSRPADQRTTAATQFLLRLDWARVGIGAGLLAAVPDLEQADLAVPFFPAAEARIGPWKRVYATGSLGSGFDHPVPVPLEVAAGLGWQGEHAGVWLGRAYAGYNAPDNLLTLKYRFSRITLMGTVGLFAFDEETLAGHYDGGQISRFAIALRYHP